MAQQHPTQSMPQAPRAERESESAAGLLSRLMGEVSTLFRKEIALAKAEMSEAASNAKSGAISLAAGGAVIYAGFLVVLYALVLLLAQTMEPWLAALIVGAVVAIIGFILLQTGKKRLHSASFTPERTQASLSKDKEMVQRRTS